MPSTTRRAKALVAAFAAEGLDHVEVVDVCGEAFRIAGERASEERVASAATLEHLGQMVEAIPAIMTRRTGR